MDNKHCIICGGNSCSCTESTGWGTWLIGCKHVPNGECAFLLDDSVEHGTKEEIRRRYNLIACRLRESIYPCASSRTRYKFYFDASTIGTPADSPEKVNIANDMVNYPRTFMERMEAALMNLSVEYPTLGEVIYLTGFVKRLLYCESDDIDSEAENVMLFLEELKYLKDESGFKFSVEGWKRIHELRKIDREVNQGFIAMEFGPHTDSISNVFFDAIRDSGYYPQRIDAKEHNNQIVPEIFHEIHKSKFIVMDVTYPNYGAYYEAGYAEALSKQVIVCCRKEEFGSPDRATRPHFDISQKCMIVWENEAELKEKLMRRIEATVGRKL